MKKLIIKIGVDMIDDLREIYKDPRKGVPNSYTIYLKDISELSFVLHDKKFFEEIEKFC